MQQAVGMYSFSVWLGVQDVGGGVSFPSVDVDI